MSRDIEGLQISGEAKFNAHIALLERINSIQCEADKYSCMPTSEAQYIWYNCVKCIERIMWPYLSKEECDRLNASRPQQFSPSNKNPINGKTSSSYSFDLARQIGNWEIEVNRTIAKRGLALKAGRDPSLALME